MPGIKKINKVYMKCKTQLAWVVSRIVPPHEIEDVVQETYVRVCQFKNKGDIRKPRALMVKTARNIALDYIKRAEWRLSSSLEDEVETSNSDFNNSIDDPLHQVATDQEFGQFCEIVRQLPQQCKKVFILKKVYGHSQREIAKELGISESTVEKHISRGMRYCTKQMLQQNEQKNKSSGTSRKEMGGNS